MPLSSTILSLNLECLCWCPCHQLSPSSLSFSSHMVDLHYFVLVPLLPTCSP
ncbi:hypothetical protein BVRB_5g107100 [Beta vulgaris subsp. vulgaris]|nr:hypothetical protein BVRB_5g107100 [Beta vulgaris subsp. vulgaris]